MPNGIPIIVTQKTKPITKYPNAEKKPPQINQIKLPIAFICILFVFYLSDGIFVAGDIYLKTFMAHFMF